jgi:glycosyltransferase involved in cell wall biosynthesis
MNYLVCQTIYLGSPLNDILTAILIAAKKSNVYFEIVNVKYSKLDSIGLDNPLEYSRDCLSAISQLLDSIKEGDKILFLDAFFPGLDILEYYLKRNQISILKIGLLHGSSFVEGDIYQNDIWLQSFEKAWYQIFDKLISPSKYFIGFLPKEFHSKIQVIPWGLNKMLTPEFNLKTIDVIYPHRFSLDKGIDIFYEIACKMPEVKFLITGVDKKLTTFYPIELSLILKKIQTLNNVAFSKMENDLQHINILKKSKIVLSTARQEGFGFAVFKSIQCGCLPVLPNSCCYPEYFPPNYLYNTIDEAIEMINKRLENYPKNYFSISVEDFSFEQLIKYFE